MNWGMACKGLEVLDKEIKSVNARFQKANVVAARAGGNVVKKKAISKIHHVGKKHKDPSLDELEKHIVTRIWKKRPSNSVALVGPLFPGSTPQQKSFFGDWVEKGHKMEIGDGQVPPNPYLRPALDESKSEIKTKMVQVYQKALDKNFNASSMIEELGENIIDSFSGESSGSDADFND
jgi:hypothetical protein